MLDFFVNIFSHCGQRFNIGEVYVDLTEMFFILVGILAAANIFHQIAVYTDDNRGRSKGIFISFSVLYVILNFFINTLIAILGLSIGGIVGMGILGISWFIFLLIFGWWQYETYGSAIGYFKLSAWITDYSLIYPRFKKYRKNIKEEYNKILNTKYQ